MAIHVLRSVCSKVAGECAVPVAMASWRPNILNVPVCMNRSTPSVERCSMQIHTMIELGLVVDTTKPSSIIRETWCNHLLQRALRELVFCRFSFDPFQLALFTESGHCCFPLLPFQVGQYACRQKAEEVLR